MTQQLENVQTEPVLRCGRCNKPFDKQATLKRHGYYCQSRKGGPVARSRSCMACVGRKARCDNRRPACSGCVARAVECHYPASRGSKVQRRSGTPAAQVSEAAHSPAADSPGNADGVDASNSDHHSPLEGALAIADPAASTDPGDAHIGWDFPAIDLADLMSSRWQTTTLDALQFSSALEPTPSAALTVQPQQAVSSPYVPIQRQPPFLFGSLAQRPTAGPKTQRTANLILHTLKSYPLMMLRNNTLPPFIHARKMSSSGAENDDDDMEPLNNCISLLHMIRSRVPGSRKLFWRNVRMECERFHQESLEWSKWRLLAAMQALSIYLIIKVDEGPTEYDNGLDSLIVAVVVTLATQMGGRVGDATLDNGGLDTRWDNWIFEESKRRLCVIYQVVDMLVYFQPAGMCHVRQQAELVIAPLPSKKQLWQAGDGFAWQAESDKEEAEARVAFALAANGELARLDLTGLLCITDWTSLHRGRDAGAPAWRTADWDEWCAGMDELGGLVMLAASLTA